MIDNIIEPTDQKTEIQLMKLLMAPYLSWLSRAFCAMFDVHGVVTPCNDAAVTSGRYNSLMNVDCLDSDPRFPYWL